MPGLTQSSPRLALPLLMAAAGVLLVSTPSAAAPIALLPIVQQGGTAETAFGIENALRKEVADTGAGQLMDRDTIIGHIAGAKSIDIVCTAADAGCLKQLGELAGVQTIISPDIKTYSAGEVLLAVLVLDVEQGVFVGRAEGKVRLDLAGRQADVRALVRAAFGLPPEAVSEVATGETTSDASAGDMTVTEEFGAVAPEQPPEETDPLGLVVLAAGGGAAVIGALVGAAGLGIWGLGVLQSSGTNSPAATVSGATGFSTVALGALGAGGVLLGVGAVAAAVGGGLFIVGSME
jgi:hypothetical protein